ncbi:MAG: MerR family transcriptional regulator [Celeribacter sp.]|jgi:DNA-binding transcriptional MerR regulator
MPKAPDAFRTISEVADWLEVQTHVLRFWETKFPQVKPLKRAGGRRYYRPADMLLLGGIKRLLHDDGMTIKGVQKMLRERGVREVADLSRPLRTDEEGYLTVAPAANAPRAPRPRTVPPIAVHDVAPSEPTLSDAVLSDTAAGQHDDTSAPHPDAPSPTTSDPVPAEAAVAEVSPAAATTSQPISDPAATGFDAQALASQTGQEGDAPAFPEPSDADAITPATDNSTAEAPFIDLGTLARPGAAAPAFADPSERPLSPQPDPSSQERAMSDPTPPEDQPGPQDQSGSDPDRTNTPSTDTPPKPHTPVGVTTDGLAEPRDNPLHDPAEPGAGIRAPRPFRPGGYGIADGAIQSPPAPQHGGTTGTDTMSEPGPLISRQLAHSLPGDATRARLRPIHDALVALRERMTKNP